MSGDELDEADEMELAGDRPRLDAFDIVQRAREASGDDGRLTRSHVAGRLGTVS